MARGGVGVRIVGDAGGAGDDAEAGGGAVGEAEVGDGVGELFVGVDGVNAAYGVGDVYAVDVDGELVAGGEEAVEAAEDVVGIVTVEDVVEGVLDG